MIKWFFKSELLVLTRGKKRKFSPDFKYLHCKCILLSRLNVANGDLQGNPNLCSRTYAKDFLRIPGDRVF
jgi:hypothetical protein